MLNNVPGAVTRMTRNIVINHPNTWECQIFRKTVNRVGDGVSGGLPTLGGIGVMSADDEEDVTFESIGVGYALQAETFMASSMMDRQDANNGFAGEFRFLIEPEEPSGMPGYFTIKKRDIAYLVISDDVKLAFEIVDIETVINIPPFAMRYVANRRGDLDI
ncbi:MAG: hypothetical protein K2Q13_10200 [Nitrosomonas sp.]|uniref:hypothetical protein n=1 Tax=Nitrosomonas sp. TaxID=42353 RepID=UPI0025E2CC1F|nr:hypothetical protein [Nitrosomonas sp.]MBY0475413.1 hypothetical protein [Nitrosomonas sp.]